MAPSSSSSSSSPGNHHANNQVAQNRMKQTKKSTGTREADKKIVLLLLIGVMFMASIIFFEPMQAYKYNDQKEAVYRITAKAEKVTSSLGGDRAMNDDDRLLAFDEIKSEFFFHDETQQEEDGFLLATTGEEDLLLQQQQQQQVIREKVPTTTITTTTEKQQVLLNTTGDEKASQQQQQQVIREAPIVDTTKTTATTVTPTRQQDSSTSSNCVLSNSHEWLTSPRRGNINATKDDWNNHHDNNLFVWKKYSMKDPLLYHIDDLMGQTLAWSTSPLVQSQRDVEKNSINDGNNNTTADIRWLTRLSFAIIYHHQHGPARKEYQEMMTNNNIDDDDDEICMEYRQQTYNLGRWDWECRNEKYLIFALQDQGLGAGASLFRQVLLEGIASNRIVMAVNHLPGVAKAWPQASCESRRDIQCVFAPLSPCVLTMDQLYNGSAVSMNFNKGSYGQLFRTGNVTMTNTTQEQPKVIWKGYAHYGTRFNIGPELFFRRLYGLAQELIQELPVDDVVTRPIWERASEMFSVNATQQQSQREFVMDIFQKAISLYMLRPNGQSRKELQQRLEDNIPNRDGDYDPKKTIGLPIRASDKCRKESSCLSFESYMDLAMYTWKESLPDQTNPPPHVIVTSESKGIYSELRDLLADPIRREQYPLRFVMNDGDTQPGSGRFRQGQANETADDGMISALSTLRLQLGSSIVRANCCSQFHRFIQDFLLVGGGGGDSGNPGDIDFQCLDGFHDPRFRICCWKKDSCLQNRNAQLEDAKKREEEQEDPIKEINVAGDFEEDLAERELELDKKLRPAGESDSQQHDSSSSSPCVRQNSHEWLTSPRRGNINATEEEWRDDDLFLWKTRDPLLHHIDDLMGQTLAWSTSPLVQSKRDLDDTSTAAADARWLTRLCFAVIYYHQHGPAQKEYQKMIVNNGTDDEVCMDYRQQTFNLGRWDWECRDEKYLIFALQDQGLGAGASLFRQVLLEGIASNRIVMAVNHFPGVAKAWPQSSCTRRDIQCVFAPLSPCVLTMDQLYNGSAASKDFNKGTYRQLYQTGEVTMTNRTQPQPKVIWKSYAHHGTNFNIGPELFFRRLYGLAKELIQELPVDDVVTRPIWERAAEMFSVNATRSEHQREFVMDIFQKAISLYMLRPNGQSRKELQQRLEDNIPHNGDDDDSSYDPKKTIGLPIRASDKCRKESSCLSFESYMDLAMYTWKESLPDQTNPPPHVIVTSESKGIYSELRDLLADPIRREQYPLRFVMNDGDTQPGSGRFRQGQANETADDGMISALSTLQLQLGSSIVRANCCSQFHRLIRDFLLVGGGGGDSGNPGDIDFQCLDGFHDPRFRICCWKSGGCLNQQKKDLEIWNELHGASSMNVTVRV